MTKRLLCGICICLIFVVVPSLACFAQQQSLEKVCDAFGGDLCGQDQICVSEEVDLEGRICCVGDPGCLSSEEAANLGDASFDVVDEKLIESKPTCSEVGGVECDLYKSCTGEWELTSDAGWLCCVGGLCVSGEVLPPSREVVPLEQEFLMEDLEKTEKEVEYQEQIVPEYVFGDEVTIEDKGVMDTLGIAFYPVMFSLIVLLFGFGIYLMYGYDEKTIAKIRQEAVNLQKYGYNKKNIKEYLLKNRHYSEKEIDYALRGVK